jgi:hypothetical protein
MQIEDTQVGTRVRVQLDYRRQHRQGTVGTIKKRYVIPEYTTFEVLFADVRIICSGFDTRPQQLPIYNG